MKETSVIKKNRDGLLTLKQAAEYLQVHTQFLYNKNCDIPFIRIGTGRGTIRYKKADLDKYIDERTETNV